MRVKENSNLLTRWHKTDDEGRISNSIVQTKSIDANKKRKEKEKKLAGWLKLARG